MNDQSHKLKNLRGLFEFDFGGNESISIDEVVVVGYKPLDDKAPALNESEIDLLKKEAHRVVLTSPQWEPGKVDGKPVAVMYTFPINFVLQ